jgi:catechol 2,3-dioxygenase-like lactoylglutathione lyase family enzyme
MLGDKNANTDIPTKDIDRARQFYHDKLGLKEVKRDERGDTTFKSGNTRIWVYQSNFAGTNQATYMSWDVDDITAAVDDLKSKGVSFEHYDMPGVTMDGDIHVMGKERAAWFKDPDGNILCVVKEG